MNGEAVWSVIAVIIVGVVACLVVGKDSRAEGYRAGWCEGRGGQWVNAVCVDSLRVRRDTLAVRRAP